MIPEPIEGTRITVQLRDKNSGSHTVSTPPAQQTPAIATPARRPRPKQPKTANIATRAIHQMTTTNHPVAHPTATAISASKQTGTITANIDGAALFKYVEGSLQRAFSAHFEYPSVARRRGWEGVVRIGLRIEPNGQLSQLRLVATSGHALLDRAALQNLARVGQVPGAADWLQGRQLDMILPVRYQLIDS